MPEHVNGYSAVLDEEEKESNELMMERGKKALTEQLACNNAE